MTASAPVIQVKRLCVRLKKNGSALVSNVDFAVNEGESLVILGESGSGKTMTCHSVMGLLDGKKFAVSGEILFGGNNLLSLKPKEKLKIYGGEIAMIPQNPMTAFDPSMRIGRQMRETLLLHSGKIPAKAADERIKSALLEAGLAETERVCKSFPYALSGGMLQRVMIAMALMADARLVIADEPTTALDVINRNATVDAFIRLREKGVAVLLVTHDFAVAAQLGGRVLIMKDSEIIDRGTAEELLEKPRHDYTRALLEASRLSKQDCVRLVKNA